MKLKEYYNDKALKYQMPKKRTKKILDLIGDVAGKKILDIGCANGELGYQLKRSGNCNVVGLDISRKSIRNASKVLDSAFEVDLLDGKLPFKKELFNVVIFSEVIEHIFNPFEVLNEISRVLKRDGLLIITTPNILYWFHRLNFLRGKFEYQKEGPFDESHIHFYTFDTLINMLNNSGFKVIKMNNLYPGSEFFSRIKNLKPELFAYQIILLCNKYEKTTYKN